jgi:hypothetical protein
VVLVTRISIQQYSNSIAEHALHVCTSALQALLHCAFTNRAQQ